MPSGGGGAGLSNPVTIATGGTGQTTAAAALAALGGSTAGSHTLKRGTGAGNYTTTSVTFVDIDTANLNISAVIPTNSIGIAVLFASMQSGAGGTMEMGILVDSTTQYASALGGGISGQPVPTVSMGVVTGDGASHTFKPQILTTNGAACAILNLSAILTPIHLLLIISAS